jgi:hypothetical protein
VEQTFDLTYALGPVPDSARRLADSLDPQVAAQVVAEQCLQLVFPDRVDDPMFVEAISRSARDNVDAMWRIIAGREALDATTPLGAIAFAATAAEVGVPVSQFERVYRVGTTITWLAWYRAARAHHEQTGVPLTELIEAPSLIIHTYIDALVTPALQRYDATRTEARRTRDQLQRSILRHALENATALDESQVREDLGFDPNGQFIAFVVRAERLNHTSLVGPAKAATECSHAVVYQHGPDSWIVWLARHTFEAQHLRRLRQAADREGHVIAIGEIAAGVAGIGATARDALEASRLQALLGDPPQTLAFADVRLESLLLKHPAEGLRFALDELQTLGEDSVRAAKLRETAMLWLATGSHVSTAATLKLHEHTVRNRITQAEELLGAPLTARRTELLVALRLLRVLRHTPSGTAGP